MDMRRIEDCSLHPTCAKALGEGLRLQLTKGGQLPWMCHLIGDGKSSTTIESGSSLKGYSANCAATKN